MEAAFLGVMMESCILFLPYTIVVWFSFAAAVIDVNRDARPSSKLIQARVQTVQGAQRFVVKQRFMQGCYSRQLARRIFRKITYVGS